MTDSLRALPGTPLTTAEEQFFDYLSAIENVEHRLAVESLLNILRTASLLTKRIEQYLSEFGLSIAKYNVLRVLTQRCSGRAPEAMPLMSDLARLLVVSGQNVTSLVDGLEAQGLVRRTPCPTDRRAIIVQATAEGEALMNKVVPLQRERTAALMQVLSVQEKDAAVKMLTRLRMSLVETDAPETSR